MHSIALLDDHNRGEEDEDYVIVNSHHVTSLEWDESFEMLDEDDGFVRISSSTEVSMVLDNIDELSSVGSQSIGVNSHLTQASIVSDNEEEDDVDNKTLMTLDTISEAPPNGDSYINNSAAANNSVSRPATRRLSKKKMRRDARRMKKLMKEAAAAQSSSSTNDNASLMAKSTSNDALQMLDPTQRRLVELNKRDRKMTRFNR